MKMHYLEYFSVLAQELHFGRAAEKLAITQPPLSSAIKALESELDVQLFVRDSKRVELTPAGRAFQEEARLILERLERATKLPKLVAKGFKGRLDVGMTSSQIYRELPRIVEHYARDMPSVEIFLKECSTAEQLEQLQNGNLHVGFLNAATVPPKLAALPLADDCFMLCLPHRHPLAGKSTVDLRQLANERFVMFARDVAPANHDNVFALFSHAGIHPTVVHAARQWITIIAMVAHGMGIALVPGKLARAKIDGVTFIRLRQTPIRASASMVWNPDQQSSMVESFVQCARRYLDKQSKTRGAPR